MIVVVGLAFEARIAARSGLRVICSGDGRNLAPTLQEAISNGCRGLISFGLAGGLVPGLPAGTCVVASTIVVGDSRLPTDSSWSQKLLEAMPGAVSGALAGAPSPVATPEAKRALHLKSGAVAVDMESHIVANAAASRGLPMVAIRVICDPVTRILPEVAVRAMRADGTTDVVALLGSVFRQPNNVPALLQVALDARAARATLLRGSRLLVRDHGGSNWLQGRALDDVRPSLSSAAG
jgi:adenosylhomocysteine nucleosidase